MMGLANKHRRAAHLLMTVYLAASAVFFITVGLPALRGEIDFQFYADSVTYMQMAEEKQHLSDLVQVELNALGPLLILRALGHNHVLIYLFNLVVFLISYRILRSSHTVDARRLTLWLIVSPLLFSSLMSVNKEILALLAIALLVAFYANGRIAYLAWGLAVSPLIRWQFTVFVLVVAVLRPFRRHRGVALAVLLAGCSLAYPVLLLTGVFETFNEIAQVGAETSIEGSGLYNLWLSLQNRFAYFVVVVPKALHLFVGLVSRISRITDLSDTNNVYNNVVATSQAVANLAILTVAVWRWRSGKLPLEQDLVFVGAIFTVVFGLSPIYSPRYLFPLYVVLAVLVAQIEETMGSPPPPTLQPPNRPSAP